MASLPHSTSRNNNYTSTDSDDSDSNSAMLASCSLQEIREEDLAAILPDQQDCDAFGGFDGRTDKNSVQTGDASGSDMELPQQAVNALIQRTTESSSESESHPPPNPSTLCANSLLQQFVAQTQLLNNAPCTGAPQDGTVTCPSLQQPEGNAALQSKDKEAVKRKRGRPKKSKVDDKGSVKQTVKGEFCANPNVSPDSGIQNSPDHVSSPESSPLPNSKLKYNNDVEVKQNGVTNNKSQHSNKNNGDAKSVTANKPSSPASKIKEQNKLPVTSNRFDRLLYANADRVLYPPRRKAGRPPINRKGPGRPPKHKTFTNPYAETKNCKPSETDKSALKPSNKVSNEKSAAKTNKVKKASGNTRDKDIVQLTSNTNSLSLGKAETKVNGAKDVTHKKTKSKLLFEICERVSKRLELNNKYSQKSQENTKQAAYAAHHKPPTLKTRKNRFVLENKNKLSNVKEQYTTLKNAKLMHSKHKHKKHKKCKFKILKPLSAPTADPKINLEVEKLIADFIRLCCISSSKPAKENIPEIVKAFKKVSKKRKTSDYNDRKKKKQTISSTLNNETSSNEQRLPLKKRHYHLSASNETKPESTVSGPVPEVKVETKAKTGVAKANTAKTEIGKPSTPSAPKYIPVIKSPNTTVKTTINNNEYEVSSAKTAAVGSHIDEAIEACITRYSSKEEAKSIAKHPKVEMSPPKQEKVGTTMAATTPKKRHRLEIASSAEKETSNIKIEQTTPDFSQEKEKIEAVKAKGKTNLESVVTELKMKKHLTNKTTEGSQKKVDKKSDVAQIITRKKNRLEDLTSTLASKINSPVTEVSETQKRKKDSVKVEEVGRDSVIKYPACKKAKPAEMEKLDFIDAKPTGIFMPTVDLEILIPSSKVTAPPTEEKDVKPLVKEIEEKSPPTDKPLEDIKPPVRLLKGAQTAEVTKRKVRKRRPINRTGFPSAKKKKKRTVETSETKAEEQPASECDRVPKDGEEYIKFLERTENYYTSDNLPLGSDMDSKWEALSECDSLPQEERTEIEADDIRIDLKHDRMNLRARDSSPTTSIDTVSSKSKIKDNQCSIEDLDDLPLEVRLKLKEKTETTKKSTGKRNLRDMDSLSSHPMHKRRFRDISPASSVEHFGVAKRLREERASASSDEAKRNRKVPRWRKKYLVAGLFSDYYKEGE